MIPAAKYDPAIGILWKGSNPTFTYLTPEDARALLATLQSTETRRLWSRTAGGVESWQRFTGDLADAIAQQTEDMLETGSFMK